jgi:UDP-glucose 4-epimerase
MASRGSVIPLFVQQIKSGKPLTVTNPDMTRFLMSIEEAVDLVLYAFQNGNQGDRFVKKSPSAKIGDLAQAIKEIFEVENEIKIIGTRHGEKMHETLLTKEEHLVSEDLGDFYRIPADTRDLNYGKYFEEGTFDLSKYVDYRSDNTTILNVEQTKEKLLSLDYIQKELEDFKNGGTKPIVSEGF